MDGYALASADGALRADSEFRIAGVIVAGGPIPAGASGAACEITTGACLPDGFGCGWQVGFRMKLQPAVGSSGQINRHGWL